MTKTVTIPEMYLAAAALVLLAIAAGFALHLWGVEGVGPCEVDAPMEQSQCRAEGRYPARGMFGGAP